MAPVAPPAPPPIPAPAKRLFLLSTLLPTALAAVALPHSPTWPGALAVGSLASLPLLLGVARLAPPLLTYTPHPALGAGAAAAAAAAAPSAPPAAALGGYVKMPAAMVVFAVGVAIVDTLPLVVVTSLLGFMSVWGVYAMGVWGGLVIAARRTGGVGGALAAPAVGAGDAEAPPAAPPGTTATAEGAAAAAVGAARRWRAVAEACLAAAAGAGVAGALRTVGGVASGGVRVAAGAVAGGAAAAAGRWGRSPPVSPPEVVSDGSSGGGGAGGAGSSAAAAAPARTVLCAATAGLVAAAAGTATAASGKPWVEATAVPLAWGAAAGAAWVAALLSHARTAAPYWDPADWGSLVRPGGVLAAALAALAVPAAVRLGGEGGVAAAAAGAARLAAERAAGAVAERPPTADWQRCARARCVRLVVVAVVETVVAAGEVCGWWGRRRLGLVSAVFLLGAVGLGDAGTGIAWVFS